MKKYILAITTALFLASMSVAHATPIKSYTNYGSFGFKSYDLTDDLDKGPDYRRDIQKIQIDGFDSSYGDLVGVSINYESRWSLSSQVGAMNTQDIQRAQEWTSRFVFAASALRIGLLSPRGDWDRHVNLQLAGCAGSTPRAECTTEAHAAGSFDGNLNYPLPRLDHFVDSYLTIGVMRELLVWAFAGNHEAPIQAINTNNEWMGRIAVTYDYNDNPSNPVPEPATMLLFGSGLMGLIGLRRKKINYRD